ncbi:MAG: hypothetical protein IJJ13_07875 [Lachnospiraceae bacterium]|nr:hypothetical protein [Lachnospiraceae bacterium]
MSLSVGAIGSLGQPSTVKPLNYALSNRSGVSSVYQKSVQNTDEVGLVHPVRYPNATLAPADPAEAAAEKQSADQGFQAIASRFAGSPVGYQADSTAVAYSMAGSMFDAIA